MIRKVVKIPKQGQRKKEKKRKRDQTNIPQLKQATIPLARLNGQERIEGNTFVLNYAVCVICNTFVLAKCDSTFILHFQACSIPDLPILCL